MKKHHKKKYPTDIITMSTQKETQSTSVREVSEETHTLFSM